MPIVIIYKLLCSFGMKLLVVNNSVLKYSEMMSLAFFWDDEFFLFKSLFAKFMMLDIPVLNLDNIFFILIYCSQKLPFNFAKMLPYFIFIQETRLLLQN